MKSPTANTSGTRKISAIGIAWYRQADYPQILRIMEDAAIMSPTYERWHGIMRKKESDLRADGYIVYRAIIDPKDFPLWCVSNGYKVDANGRIAFATEYAARQQGL